MIAFVTSWQRGRFIEELEVSGNVAFACAAAGITHAEAHDEREHQPLFEQAWRLAQARARRDLEARS